MNYGVDCHSLQYLRYSRIAADVVRSEVQVMRHLNFNLAKISDTIMTAMRVDAAAQWFGKMPPDLGLTARVRGSDWIYAYSEVFLRRLDLLAGLEQSVVCRRFCAQSIVAAAGRATGRICRGIAG
ncbi:hypothetical protein AF72_02865 [Xylella taiwanensis]|uniref:Uncharacterized protein n=1 Tax=Xylella taiwanensis TaxID=1444770 RepID=Z9JKH6_9GAMM|nr:hypothetical protein AF72_02865 [Xylella taiwanensis]